MADMSPRLPSSSHSSTPFVPWEPYKAATSAEKRCTLPPPHIPTLLPYTHTPSSPRQSKESTISPTGRPLVDSRRERMKQSVVERERTMQDEIERLQKALALQTERAEGLRRVLTTAMESDMATYVAQLSEEKMQLAHVVHENTQQIARECDEMECLRIERDVWRAKFLAMGVKADEESMRAARALAYTQAAQKLLQECLPLLPPSLRGRADHLSSTSLHPLFARSPCDEKVHPRDAVYRNLTITCCPQCAGREIYLL